MLANKGRMQAEAGGKIEQCFVGDGMLAWLHIITGKVKEAEELLTRFKGKAQQEFCRISIPFSFAVHYMMRTKQRLQNGLPRHRMKN